MFTSMEQDEGSSPRVWGQALSSLQSIKYARIIPTRMGTRGKSARRTGKAWDHPHAYGDKLFTCNLFGVGWGSSPRVWGQENRHIVKFTAWRIIPTRMGTSIIHFFNPFFKTDHPHAYGDKPKVIILMLAVMGSSPRVWGQVSPFVTLIDLHGIIPTRMGTSCHCFLEVVTSRDHPHAYGDK